MEKVYDGSPMIEVNGRRYALPRAPVVVVCVDGCEPDYLDRAVGGRRDARVRIAARRRPLARRRLRDAPVHDPHQPLDRDGRATAGARTPGNLLRGPPGGLGVP